ncbi:hypothetical protein Cpir12675_000622 [Ceratocystis pirilliformis]|uniref:CoA-binding domain-containing protein n=1 Tax=Ceratocystis pirilliformis TaxID=259994 RepID=A0ABR3ZK84_9PEZI
MAIPTLRTLSLRTRPLNTHALAWSGDAELAVGADESIHVFLPEFSVAASQAQAASTAPLPSLTAATGSATATPNTAVSREQFFSTKLRIPVPAAINPRINAHIAMQNATGEKATPRDETGLLATGAGQATRLRTVDSDDDEEDYENEDDAGVDRDDAGYGCGPVTGFGGSLNQIVALAWSPSNLGLNGRPVLSAVLTCGTVLVYGEGELDKEDMPIGTLRERSFERWKILWGIGGPLPGVGWRDRVKAWAWAREIGWGRALAAYVTDMDELVVVAVERRGESLADWKIKEVASFHAAGPHEKVDVNDPDYVPSASPFGLRWSPWAQTADGTTVTLGYVATSYIGFRRLTISSWADGKDPVIKTDEADSEGLCLHLGIDSFFEWENTVFQDGESLACRGIIATPLHAKPFQISLTGKRGASMPIHRVADCGTTYPDQGGQENACQNPITGMFAPFSFPSLFSYEACIPQWANEIERLVNLRLPPSMAYKGALSDSENDGSASSSAGSDSDSDDDLQIDADAQVHPNRVRIWALAASPACGSSALLFSRSVTLYPDRPQRSKVAFGWLPATDADEERSTPAAQLSAEGRAWEWMYGGGPPVPGVSQPLYVAAPTAADGGVRGLFASLVGQHQCVFCDGALRWQMGGYYECVKGHSFETLLFDTSLFHHPTKSTMKSPISATDATARAFFTSKAFAVVGASSDPAKFGHQVFAWYLVNSLPVTPLNPHSSSITVSGKSVATVSGVSALPNPTHTGVSIITPPSATLKVLRDAHEAGVRAVWLQPGTWDEAVVEYLAPGEDGVSPFETVVAGEGGRGHGGWCVLVDGEKALGAVGKL